MDMFHFHFSEDLWYMLNLSFIDAGKFILLNTVSSTFPMCLLFGALINYIHDFFSFYSSIFTSFNFISLSTYSVIIIH